MKNKDGCEEYESRKREGGEGGQFMDEDDGGMTVHGKWERKKRKDNVKMIQKQVKQKAEMDNK